MFVMPGKVLAFYGFQYGDPVGATILGDHPELPPLDYPLAHMPAVSNITVNIRVMAPSGDVVFDRTVVTDKDGSFPKIAFPITENMGQGLYLVYYSATMPDGSYVHYIGDDADNVDWFYVTRIQNFTVEAEGKTYDVVLQGVGINASNVMFDKDSKALSLDIHRIDGKYDNRQFINSVGSNECPLLYIEEPLLTGPFSMVFNDEPIGGCGDPLWNNAGQMVIGPLNESGKITILGTYAVPEFGSAALILLGVTLTSGLVMSRLRTRFQKNP